MEILLDTEHFKRAQAHPSGRQIAVTCTIILPLDHRPADNIRAAFARPVVPRTHARVGRSVPAPSEASDGGRKASGRRSLRSSPSWLHQHSPIAMVTGNHPIRCPRQNGVKLPTSGGSRRSTRISRSINAPVFSGHSRQRFQPLTPI